MQRSGFFGNLSGLAGWISRLAMLNLQWVSLNLPVLIIGFYILFTPMETILPIHFVLMLIWMPLVCLPSTIAVVIKIREWIVMKEHIGGQQTYWSYLKENYSRKIFFSLWLTLYWFIWIAAFFFLNMLLPVLGTVLVFIGLVLFVYTLNSISMYAHYDIPNRPLLKRTFSITISSPFLFIAVLAINVFSWYFSVTVFPILIPFFTVSISLFVSFWVFYRARLNANQNT
ncbi:hypothetical protein ACFO3D_05465 [Virgibacillus kekensis]|uniref:DUF624 domain-containing protein n=1 Tax=Virgibacillus kekensis TaxID=202261 RepID=A0ABV9DFU3_9BACI